MRPPNNRSTPRRLIVGLVGALLLFYVGLAAWFTHGIISGRQGLTPLERALQHSDDLLPVSSRPPVNRAIPVKPSRVAGQKNAPSVIASTTTTTTEPPTPLIDPNDDIHIVFSTGCNYFQHWQAEVLLHSHMKVGQRGKITRVVSGCDTENVKRKHAKFLTHPEGLADETVPLEELQKSSHPNMHLHVTPSFEGAREFPWINKPMGIHHWLMHADPPVTESVIVIIDPDMFFMDTITQDGSKSIKGENRPYGENGLLCTDVRFCSPHTHTHTLSLSRCRRCRPRTRLVSLSHALTMCSFFPPLSTLQNFTGLPTR